jgi:ribose 5-phosphate isomerase B
MKVHFATDHAGWELKNELLNYVRDELGYEVVDHGAHVYDADDDYTQFIGPAIAALVPGLPQDRAIILGGSGEGEAMLANRTRGVRATVYYGPRIQVSASDGEVSADPLAIIRLGREHNDSNVLALGARFLTLDEARVAVSLWLTTPFSQAERHVRRREALDR